MNNVNEEPRIYRVLHEDALEIHRSASGSVGTVFSDEGIEAVWVKKQSEEIDPDWFSQPMVDLILVLRGKLKMEFERTDLSPCVLKPGDLIVLPPDIRCRAYHWPRDAEDATIFLAFYPVP